MHHGELLLAPLLRTTLGWNRVNGLIWMHGSRSRDVGEKFGEAPGKAALQGNFLRRRVWPSGLAELCSAFASAARRSTPPWGVVVDERIRKECLLLTVVQVVDT